MTAILNLQSLMVGSMPQKEPAEALDVADRYPTSIPTWPQLPKRSFKEAMVPQYSEGFPGVRVNEVDKKIWVQRDDELFNDMAAFYEQIVSENIDALALSGDYAGSLPLFIDRLKAGPGPLPFVKGQVTGPFTFGLGLNDNDGKAVWFDEPYRDVVIKGIIGKAQWLFRQLKPYAQRVIIFFDEPILSALGTAAYLSIRDEDVILYLNEVIGALQQEGAIVGVHCCGNMDWGVLARTRLDIISFDAYFYGEKLALYPRQITEFLERGGCLAWGIVPTAEVEALHRESADSLRQKMAELTALFARKGIPEQRMRQQMLLTPSCGLGFLPPADAALVLDLLSQLTALMSK
jgi:hypothetical protein